MNNPLSTLTHSLTHSSLTRKLLFILQNPDQMALPPGSLPEQNPEPTLPCGLEVSEFPAQGHRGSGVTRETGQQSAPLGSLGVGAGQDPEFLAPLCPILAPSLPLKLLVLLFVMVRTPPLKGIGAIIAANRTFWNLFYALRTLVYPSACPLFPPLPGSAEYRVDHGIRFTGAHCVPNTALSTQLAASHFSLPEP